MNQKIAWTDYKGRPVELTDKEIEWFSGIAELAKKATGYNVRILPFNHDLYQGKSKEALGCIITDDMENRLEEGADTFITIDTYFIHEKYSELFEGGYSVERETLEHVIAHELAHLTHWRHTKKHADKTEELYQLIIEAEQAEQAEQAARSCQKAADQDADPAAERTRALPESSGKEPAEEWGSFRRAACEPSSAWKRTGIVRDEKGTTVFYSLQGTRWSIESRKRHIPHADGVGTWDYASFFVLRDGKEIEEKYTLKEAKTYAESLEAKERGKEKEKERHKPSEWRVGHQCTVGLKFVRVYRIRDQAEPDHSGNRIWIDKIFDTDEEAQAEADRLNALEKSRKTD